MSQLPEILAVLGSIVALVTLIYQRRAKREDARDAKAFREDRKAAATEVQREIRKMALFDALKRRDKSAMHRALVEQLRIAREGGATAGGSERAQGE